MKLTNSFVFVLFSDLFYRGSVRNISRGFAWSKAKVMGSRRTWRLWSTELKSWTTRRLLHEVHLALGSFLPLILSFLDNLKYIFELFQKVIINLDGHKLNLNIKQLKIQLQSQRTLSVLLNVLYFHLSRSQRQSIKMFWLWHFLKIDQTVQRPARGCELNNFYKCGYKCGLELYCFLQTNLFGIWHLQNRLKIDWTDG